MHNNQQKKQRLTYHDDFYQTIKLKHVMQIRTMIFINHFYGVSRFVNLVASLENIVSFFGYSLSVNSIKQIVCKIWNEGRSR